MIAAWLARLNQRERVLALGVAGLLFLLVNWLIWSALLGMSSNLRRTWANDRSTRTEQQVYLKEYDKWQQRSQWLKKHELTLRDPAEASSLLTEIQQIAQKYKVEIDNPQIGTVENAPTHQSVSATIETKSAWEPLVHFLYDVQKPDAFIVFEDANLMIDSNDPTVMRGRFKIAKWFAPAGGSKP